MKTITEIGIYEIADVSVAHPDEHMLQISSHWNSDDRVVLEWGKGKSITVIAEQLKRAIDRATR